MALSSAANTVIQLNRFVLYVRELAKHARKLRDQYDRVALADAPSRDAAIAEARLSLTAANVVDFATLTDMVARLEEIDLTKVERSNDKAVVQYRGRLMPLVQMNGAIELPSEGRAPRTRGGRWATTVARRATVSMASVRSASRLRTYRASASVRDSRSGRSSSRARLTFTIPARAV